LSTSKIPLRFAANVKCSFCKPLIGLFNSFWWPSKLSPLTSGNFSMQSVLGVVLSKKRCSNVPDHSTLLVKKFLNPHYFLSVANTEVEVYSLSGKGPSGLWTTFPFSSQGDIKMVGILIPSLVKLKSGLVCSIPSGFGTLSGVGKWS